MIVTTMKRTIGSIFINKCSSMEGLLLEAIVDLVQIYNYWSGEDADDDLSKQFDGMVEERGNSTDSENLRSNLLEVHSKIRYWVKDKLTNVLTPLLKIPASTKYYY